MAVARPLICVSKCQTSINCFNFILRIMSSNKGKLVVISTIIKEWIELTNRTAQEIILYIASISSEYQDDICDCDPALLSRDVRPVRIKNYVQRNIPGYTGSEFKQHFRMPREAYEKLLKIVSLKLLESSQKPRNVEKDLLSTISILATPDSFREIRPRKVVAIVCLDILNVISRDVIKWPTLTEMEEIQNVFENKSHIKKIIGAIDGTYVKIDAPKEWPEQYINRKGYHSITLQAVCDHKLKFTDCFVGYPSSVHDCRIFHNSDLYTDVIQNIDEYFPGGRYLLGDKAYPQMMCCLVPYKNNGKLTSVKKNFNSYHSKARQTIERAFALLFGRFRRLKHLSMKSQKYIPRTVIAGCVLHNICLDFPDDLSYVDVDYVHSGDDRGDYFVGSAEENSTQALNLRDQIAEEISIWISNGTEN